MLAKVRFQSSSSSGRPRTKPPPWMVKRVGSDCGEVWSYEEGKKMLCVGVGS